MFRAAPALTLLVLLPFFALRAQGPWPPGIGQRVRVTTDSGAWVGTLVQHDSTSITLHGPGLSDSAAVTLPLDRVRQLEISVGRQSNAGKGALIGFGVGAATGLALGIGCASSDSFFQCNGSQVVESTVVFGFIGAGVGGLVGLASSSERWVKVTAEPVHVSLAPHHLGLSVSLTF
jgi:hypothetical protein